MAKKTDPKIIHPEPDTSANEGTDGEPPPTWNPKKVRPEDKSTK